MASELKHSDGVKSSNISLGQIEAFQKAKSCKRAQHIMTCWVLNVQRPIIDQLINGSIPKVPYQVLFMDLLIKFVYAEVQ